MPRCYFMFFFLPHLYTRRRQFTNSPIHLLGGTAGFLLGGGTGGTSFDPPPEEVAPTDPLLTGTGGGACEQDCTSTVGRDEGRQLIVLFPNNTIMWNAIQNSFRSNVQRCCWSTSWNNEVSNVSSSFCVWSVNKKMDGKKGMKEKNTITKEINKLSVFDFFFLRFRAI